MERVLLERVAQHGSKPAGYLEHNAPCAWFCLGYLPTIMVFFPNQLQRKLLLPGCMSKILCLDIVVYLVYEKRAVVWSKQNIFLVVYVNSSARHTTNAPGCPWAPETAIWGLFTQKKAKLRLPMAATVRSS